MSASTERPLHVRVAEALGCKPEVQRKNWPDNWWAYTCPGLIHNCEGPDGAPHEGDLLEAYDTDWSAILALKEAGKL